MTSTVENVKRKRAEGDQQGAEQMLRALRRHEAERAPSRKKPTDDRATCTLHHAHGHQADCWWCRQIEEERSQ